MFRTHRGLARWPAHHGATGHDLAATSTWPAIRERARAGELEIHIADINCYTPGGIEECIAGDIDALSPVSWGTGRPDPYWPAQACELLLDVGAWAGDDAAREALSPAQPLGRLVASILDPHAARPSPGPARTTEASQWRELVDTLTARFRVH